MRLQWLACLSFASIVFAQAAPPTPAGSAGGTAAQAVPATPARPAAAKVGPHDTVLTVKGVCANPSKQGEDCKTEIDKAEFEKLVEALQPNMNALVRRQLANSYASMLVMSAAAEKRGLDKQPAFDERMRFDRMQVLSLLLRRSLKEDADKVSDADIEDYYNKHAANYEEGGFARIFVPANQIVSAKPGEKKGAETSPPPKASEGTMKKVAAELRDRAAKGEDPDKLQKEAFMAAGMTWAPPTTKMEARRSTLPVGHAAAFDLKPGEVSEPISDSSGHYIYKLLSKKMLPLDSLKQEIRGTLSAERYRDAMQPFQTGNTELNEAYFGPSPRPADKPAPARGAKPTQEEDNDPN